VPRKDLQEQVTVIDVSGYVPELVTTHRRVKCVVQTHWGGDRPVTIGEPISTREVYPAFAVPAGKESWEKTAKRWTNSTRRHGEVTPRPVTKKNVGMRLVLCSLETRSEGGRAYKVVTEDDCYFDLREDVLLEAILSCGVVPGGLLGGTYCWIVQGSQSKLVREGSALHAAFVKATGRRHLEKLKTEDLVVGGIYSGKGAGRKVYLGEVLVPGENGKKATRRFFWFVAPAYLDTHEKLLRAIQCHEQNRYYFKLSKSHDVVEQVGQLEIDSAEDLVSMVSDADYAALVRYAKPSSHQADREKWLAANRDVCLMYSPGKTPPDRPLYR